MKDPIKRRLEEVELLKGGTELRYGMIISRSKLLNCPSPSLPVAVLHHKFEKKAKVPRLKPLYLD
jgi:hypothetical protein